MLLTHGSSLDEFLGDVNRHFLAKHGDVLLGMNLEKTKKVLGSWGGECMCMWDEDGEGGLI